MQLTPDDLHGLERYAQIRGAFRAHVMAHKRPRRVPVGPHATLYFEDRLTIQYQIQEMLRVERVFEPAGIKCELDAYNPLIPDGGNWKATFMIEYADPAERRQALARLRGIEEAVWVQVAGFDRVFAIANEDMARADPAKTASVHFLRFELTAPMVDAVKGGAAIGCGTEHAAYRHAVQLVPESRVSLAADLA